MIVYTQEEDEEQTLETLLQQRNVKTKRAAPRKVICV
jgi:hypothetical protein